MNNQTIGGISFAGALFLVFLILKLVHVIAWSWWWVTAPLWLPFLLAVLFVFGTVVYYEVKNNRSKSKSKK